MNNLFVLLDHLLQRLRVPSRIYIEIYPPLKTGFPWFANIREEGSTIGTPNLIRIDWFHGESYQLTKMNCQEEVAGINECLGKVLEILEKGRS